MIAAVSATRPIRIPGWIVGAWMAMATRTTVKERAIERSVSVDSAAVRADLAAAARGDGEAYARIVRSYQPLVARRMVRFTRDAAVAEELVHDVFVEAYFSLKKYRGGAPFEHWLQRIVTRVGYRFWKRQRREKTRVEAVAARVPVEKRAAETERDAAERLALVLEKLPPRDRLVITLLYLEERSVEEAAPLCGWSKTMVKVQAHRARGKLRKLLEGRHE